MKIIITSLQVSTSGSKGHLHPATEIALEAKRRGHNVSILPLPSKLGIEDEDQLKRAGINYILPPSLPKGLIKAKEELAAFAANPEFAYKAYQSFLVDPLEIQYEKLLSLFKEEKPDVIIYDLLVYSASLAARTLNIPDFGYCAGLKLIAPDSLQTTYINIHQKIAPQINAFSNQLSLHSDFRYLELLSNFGNYVFVPQRAIFNKQSAMSEKDSAFQEKDSNRVFKLTQGDYTFTLAGPLPMSDDRNDNVDTPTIPSKPYAILCFGSALDPFDYPDITQSVIQMSIELDLELYIRSSKDISNKQLPGNVIVKKYLHLKALLAEAAVYIHHGGANSFSEALYVGTPQILIPLTTDQPIQAAVLNQLGCGISITPQNVSISTLTSAGNILMDKSNKIHDTIKTVREMYRSENGPRVLITEIENELYVRNIYREPAKIKSVLKPQNIDEVVTIIQQANIEKTPVYPISGGKNYGLGSKLPMVNNSTIIDLKEINNINDFDEHSGTIRIGAGVTQKQLHQYLEQHSADYFLNITGSSEDSSIIGNIAEKGVGHYGLRHNDVISFKVILGTAELIECGGSTVLNSLSANSYALGLGPDIKGLFLQSNLGIILEATIKLIPKNENITIVSFSKKNGITLEQFVDKISTLRKENILPTNIHISNRERKLSVLTALLAKFKNLSIKEAEQILTEQGLYLSEYFAIASLNYDYRLLKVYKEVILNEMSSVADISFVNVKDIEAAQDDITKAVSGTFYHSFGVPSDDAIFSLGYQQEQMLNPKQLENCNSGTFFNVPILPFKGKSVKDVDTIVNNVFSQSGFTAFITFNYVDHFNLEAVINLTFDNRSEEQKKQAKHTARSVFKALNQAGYTPQRMSVFHVDSFDQYDSTYKQFIKKLKPVLDPNNILSPGRYGF